MLNDWISSAILFAKKTSRKINKVITSCQLPKEVTAIAFVGLLLLTTSVDTSSLEPGAKATLNDMISQGENGRPMTTGQWQAENEKLQGEPGKQAERIAKESADAVGEMAEIYPENAKTVLPGMSNDSLER